ncbi:unnamed protein product, partial [Ilex paraguariensis]
SPSKMNGARDLVPEMSSQRSMLPGKEKMQRSLGEEVNSDGAIGTKGGSEAVAGVMLTAREGRACVL